MRQYCLSERAQNDLEKLKRDYSEKYDLDFAVDYLSQIRFACVLLVKDSSLGTKYEGFNPKYSYFHVEDHTIYYRLKANTIFVAAIIRKNEIPDI